MDQNRFDGLTRALGAAAFSRPGPTSVTVTSRKGDGSACGGKWFIANGAVVFNEALAQDSLVSVLVI